MLRNGSDLVAGLNEARKQLVKENLNFQNYCACLCAGYRLHCGNDVLYSAFASWCSRLYQSWEFFDRTDDRERYGRELLVYTNVFLSNLDHAPNFSRIRKTDMSF